MTAHKTDFPRSPLRSEKRVRDLGADNLFPTGAFPDSLLPIEHVEPYQQDLAAVPLTSEIGDDNDLLLEVRDLIEDYAGVIFTGPPGTSKSWYAAQVAAKLVDLDPVRVRFIQFHASYQYEDFVEGYVPKEDGSGFILVPKHLLEMCKVARGHEGKLCVIVIDELSRSDPGRVFGEALTYIETTKRNQPFHLASGRTASIPPNLFFIATMNPQDRGVDEVDAALERRFAKIAMEPSAVVLDDLLSRKGMEDDLRGRVVRFFRYLLGNSNERCRVGHAYFRAAANEDDLKSLWDHQLRFHMEKAFPLKGDALRAIEAEWNKIFPAPAPAGGDGAAAPAGESEGGPS